MASPNNNDNLKKFNAPRSPGQIVRRIPSSFDSPVIHTGQYVVEGAAERISQTRIPEEEHEPKRTGERRRLERTSDQATVIMTMPDGFFDFQDKKVKNTIKSSIGKTTALNQSKQPSKVGPSKNGPAAKNGKTVSQKDQICRQLSQMQAQQVALTCKQLISTEPKEDTSKNRDSLDTDDRVLCSQYSESPATSTFANKNGRKKSSFRCCPKSKNDSCCFVN